MNAQKELRAKMRVYFVVGSQDCDYSVEKTIQTTEQALTGGVSLVQLRDKKSKLDEEQQESLARKIQALCREHGALFFVNDNVKLAVQLNADGVHIGQDDMSLGHVRQLTNGGAMYIGVSAGTVQEALEAKRGGADYIGVGAMYATASKADAGEPIGPGGLAQIRMAIGEELPIVGIGGINVDNALPVLEAGADGIAVISAISKATDPRVAAIQLKNLVDGFRSE